MHCENPITTRRLGVHRRGAGYRRTSKGRRKSTNLGLSDHRQKATSALLVYAEFEPLHTLRVALAGQGIDTWRARSCQQALTFLSKFRPVHVIFTDMNLPDGTWLDLARAKRRITAPLIVVARGMDARLWSEVLEQGAAGLMVPPFAVSNLINPARPHEPAVVQTAAHWQNLKFDNVRPRPTADNPLALLGARGVIPGRGESRVRVRQSP